MQPRYALDRLSFGIFCAMVVELVVGGGGRLTAIGPVSLRMVFFAMGLIITGVHFFKGRRLPGSFIRLMIVTTIVLSAGVMIGVANGSQPGAWWEDVKPLLYLFMVPFFYFSIAHRDQVWVVTSLMRRSALLMGIAFVVILVLINSGAIRFLHFYHFVLPTQEFFFRGELSFVYKGFIHFGVGVIFWYFVRPNKVAVAFLVICIILSFTRGFLLALFITFALYYAWQYWATRKRSTIVLTFVFFVSGFLVAYKGQEGISRISMAIDHLQRMALRAEGDQQSLDKNLLGNREYSDVRRTIQLQQVGERITPLSAIVGHGFGQGIPERPVHMEISYLEIFHKQGIIGLLFWGYLVWMIAQAFRKVYDKPLATPLLLATFYILIQSFVNQYINNPIGIAIALITLVGLHRLQDPQIPVNKTVTSPFVK